MLIEAEARIAQYELEVEIKGSREGVWRALTEEIDAWWLADFRMVGSDSRVSFEPRAGGSLIERREDGGSLLWYTVQMAVPEESLHLVGYTGADWGGPSVSMLKLALVEKEGVCALRVTDSLFGRVSDDQKKSLLEGWRRLFTEGLKRHVEGS